MEFSHLGCPRMRATMGGAITRGRLGVGSWVPLGHQRPQHARVSNPTTSLRALERRWPGELRELHPWFLNTIAPGIVGVAGVRRAPHRFPGFAANQHQIRSNPRAGATGRVLPRTLWWVAIAEWRASRKRTSQRPRTSTSQVRNL